MVVRGEFYLDFNFIGNWNVELEAMNKNKIGAPFLYPESFMEWQTVWHQFADYRGLEGVTRSLEKLKIIPYHDNYTTAWYRIHKMKPEITLPDYNGLEIGSDGTGLKSNNAGEYRIFKYGERTRKKYLVVIITADVKHKKLLSVDAHMEGEGDDEPKVAIRQIKKIKRNRKKIKSLYADGKFDTNYVFKELAKYNIIPKIPIKINASPSFSSPQRRKQTRLRFGLPTGKKSHDPYFKDTKVKRYKCQKKWKENVKYGNRWPGTEGISSAVKRKFGENVINRKKDNMVAEAIQRFWAYDIICNYALQKQKM